MNTLFDKIVAVAMMLGSTGMFAEMAYNIVLMFGRTYVFKWECIVLFVIMMLLAVLLFYGGVKQFKGEEL